ncbi:hypothetical protein N9M15_05870 [Bacteroidia bacterium]|nr:hypothetical protein [Bacteroidia bacterium]
MSSLTNHTVSSILKNPYLNDKFVVARGWENLPDISGDLDLFVRFSDWAIFEKQFGFIAKLQGWDELVLDCSWASGFDYSRILVFYFRMKDGSECLQVDLFNGYSVLGCGYLKADEILRTRESHEGIFIPSTKYFKELREFQIYRHLNWFRDSQNHRVLHHIVYFKIDKAQNSKLKLRIAIKRLRILALSVIFLKKVNILDRLIYYKNVVNRFRHDAVYAGDKNRKVWITATELLLRNKYVRDSLIIDKVNLLNILNVLRVIERNGVLIILNQEDFPSIDVEYAVQALTKLKLNQRYCQ